MNDDVKKEGQEKAGFWQCPKCDETFRTGHGEHSGAEDKCPRCRGTLEFVEKKP
jgi:rubrerythrin